MVGLTPSFLSLRCPSIISARDCGRADALSSNSQFSSCYLSTTVICFITQLTSCYLRTCSAPVYDSDALASIIDLNSCYLSTFPVVGLSSPQSLGCPRVSTMIVFVRADTLADITYSTSCYLRACLYHCGRANALAFITQLFSCYSRTPKRSG